MNPDATILAARFELAESLGVDPTVAIDHPADLEVAAARAEPTLDTANLAD